MSILIRGMEMPTKIEPGLVIEFAVGIDGKRYARLHHYRHGGLTDWLEAVPVPPHGRLIDADALGKVMSEGIAPSVKDGGFKHPFDIIRAVANAPTIIEAEEGE